MLVQNIQSGSVVKRCHPFDGSIYAGKPTGRFLHVKSMRELNHPEGSAGEFAALLDDGKEEYVWNLVEIDIDN